MSARGAFRPFPFAALVDMARSHSRTSRRSFPALASGVFPHRFKLHKLGEFLAAAFVLGGSIVRTALGVVAAAEVVVDLLVPERRRRDWEREIAVGVISLVWVSSSPCIFRNRPARLADCAA